MRETWQRGEPRTYVLPLETFQFPHPLLCKAAYPDFPDMNVFGGHYYLLAAPEHSRIIAPAEMDIKDFYRNTPNGAEWDGLNLTHPSGDGMYFGEVVTLNRTEEKQGRCFAMVGKSRDGNPANAHLRFSFFPRDDYDSDNPNSLFHQLYRRRTIEYDAIEATVRDMFPENSLGEIVDKLKKYRELNYLTGVRVFEQVESLRQSGNLLPANVSSPGQEPSFEDRVESLRTARYDTLMDKSVSYGFGGICIAALAFGSVFGGSIAAPLIFVLSAAAVIKKASKLEEKIEQDPLFQELFTVEKEVRKNRKLLAA